MRNLSPQIFMDEFIGAQSMRLRLLWIGLILSMADDQGRMIDNPAIMRATIFPYDEEIKTEDVETDLQLLADAHKVHRYQAGTNGDGRSLIQIVKWWDHQTRAQWASRSNYPAPDKWVDRIRCHERGSGQKIIEINWKKAGGFTKALPKALPSHLASALPKSLPSREDEDEEKGRGRGRRKRSTPPPTPPSGGMAGGGQAGQPKKQSKIDIGPYDGLKPMEIKRARQAAVVLAAAGLGEPKLSVVSVIVATRISIADPQQYVLGALASAYKDDGAKNKLAVAAYRIEHNLVEAEYMKPKNWGHVPKEVLRASGIDNLMEYRIKGFRGDKP